MKQVLILIHQTVDTVHVCCATNPFGVYESVLTMMNCGNNSIFFPLVIAIVFLVKCFTGGSMAQNATFQISILANH